MFFWLSRSIIIFIITSPPSTNDNRNRFPKWMCFWFGNGLAAAVICPDQGHVVPPLRRAEDLSEESYKTHLKRLGSFLGASWSPKRLQEARARWDLKLGAWLGAVGEFGIDAWCARFKPNLVVGFKYLCFFNHIWDMIGWECWDSFFWGDWLKHVKTC